jgi:hypothetical protein
MMNHIKRIAELDFSKVGDRRALFLYDLGKSRLVWGWVHHSYDNPEDPHVIASLFDESVVKLAAALPGQVLTAAELPILSGIGRYQITCISKRPTGVIEIWDAQRPDISALMGLEA